MKSKPQIIEKLLRHNFTPEESNELGGDLARAMAHKRDVENEFDEVKVAFKARLTECDAKLGRLQTNRLNGFDMRLQRCWVKYDPARGRKFYFAESADEKSQPLAEEKMESGDFQIEMFEAESAFASKEEIQLFPRAGEDSGILMVGKCGKFWSASVRAKIGSHALCERLDADGASAKERIGAIERAIARFTKFVREKIGKEELKGFMPALEKILADQKEVTP